MSNFYWFFLFLNQAAVVVMWTRCEIDSIFSADWRVRPLVLYIKKWARFHDINDASKATISSYSLCLMLIHYLQCMSSLSFNTSTSCCLCGEFSHVLSFLTMYSVSSNDVHVHLQVFSGSDYLLLQFTCSWSHFSCYHCISFHLQMLAPHRYFPPYRSSTLWVNQVCS